MAFHTIQPSSFPLFVVFFMSDLSNDRAVITDYEAYARIV